MYIKYDFIVLLTVTLLFSFHVLSNAFDSLNSTQILRDGETIISDNGRFELGFFSLGNSSSRYVGIWYKKVTVRPVVWVANRERALTSTSGLLRVIEPGLIVIQDEANVTIWSSNTTSSTLHAPVVQLLDSGNLVLKDANDNNFIWESFNYPTDTLIPGMKLDWNYITNHEVYLSSWKSNDDPAAGDYSLHCDPTGYPQNVIRKGAVKMQRTGPWNGLWFNGFPSLQENPIFRRSLVMNMNEVYYHYVVLNSSVISRFTVFSSGILQRSIWTDLTQGWSNYLNLPADNCDYYGSCGVYGSCDSANSQVCGCLNRFIPKNPASWERGDWTEGCVRKKPLNCSKGDAFLKYSGIKFPDTQNSWYNESMTLGQCKERCIQNCSCMAYANLDISRRPATGCLLWFGDLVDIKEVPTDLLHNKILITGPARRWTGNCSETAFRNILTRSK